MPLRQNWMELWTVSVSSSSLLVLPIWYLLKAIKLLRQEKRPAGNPWGMLLGHWAVYSVYSYKHQQAFTWIEGLTWSLREAPHTWNGRETFPLHPACARVCSVHILQLTEEIHLCAYLRDIRSSSVKWVTEWRSLGFWSLLSYKHQQPVFITLL